MPRNAASGLFTVPSKLPKDISDRIQYAGQYLENRKDLIFAYLFGGLVNGAAKPLSDVDIAVYLDEGVDCLEVKAVLSWLMKPYYDRVDAEKSIKAFIYAQGEDFVVGHSVEVLCRWASEFDKDFEKLMENVAPLDAYYIPTRYPNELPDSIPAKVYTKPVAREVLKLADLVLRLVRKKFSAAP